LRLNAIFFNHTWILAFTDWDNKMIKTIKKSTSYHAQALSRGLELLSYLSASTKGHESLNTLHEATLLPKSTLIRLLTVLEKNHYIRRVNNLNNYRLGSAVVDLARSYQTHLSIREISTPYLSSLAKEFGHTAELGVLESGTVTLLNTHESDRKLRFHSKVGSIWPWHCTSLGKILLAGLRDIESLALLTDSTPFEKRTRLTITAPEEIMADIARSKIRGYAISCEEHDEGVCAIATPIRKNGTEMVWNAAVSVTGPVGELVHKTKDSIIRALKNTTDEMSKDLELTNVLEMTQ
jgi:DNA-binding IclR family transcriptional regulator